MVSDSFFISESIELLTVFISSILEVAAPFRDKYNAVVW